MRALERCDPLCAACGQKLPRPDDLPEPGMGYKHDEERFQAWLEKWRKALGDWLDNYDEYSGQMTAIYEVPCLDCGMPNSARFYREQA